MADGKARAGLRTYLEQSKELGTSVVLVLPLFVAYQLGILATGGLRNGVDFVSNTLVALFNNSMLGYLAFNGAILLLFGGVLAYQHKKGALHPRIFPWMLLESAVYALLLGSTVIFLINAIGLGGLLQIAAAAGEPSLNLVEKLVMSAGAGLYEEVVFRLFLMGGLFLIAHKVIGLPRLLGAILAVLASSVIFSAVHHISEPFTMSAFTFRIFAGLLFAVIFQVRGLAVAAYTHFLYDVYVMVFRQ